MKDRFLIALLKEIDVQKNYLEHENIKTIYFGGGTPSLLTSIEINSIIDALKKYHTISADVEITLEANPDDLTFQKLEELKQSPLNRLSIGIQSFFDEDLKWMNRAHHAKQAKECIVQAQQIGFKNITIDFIYGTPTLSDKNWLLNLETAFHLNVPHISAYSLTVEPRTALAGFVKSKKLKAPDEEQASRQFEMLMEQMALNNFSHYEISNFAKEGFVSQHNSSYWRGEKYLGLGPSAHSYNRITRQWNIANNAIYIKSLDENKKAFEEERITTANRFNEYLLTSLRTIWGCDSEYIKKYFPVAYYDHYIKQSQIYLQQGYIQQHQAILTLTNKGKLLADKITADLFFTEI